MYCPKEGRNTKHRRMDISELDDLSKVLTKLSNEERWKCTVCGNTIGIQENK
jgi:rubrerythrin